jgi:hypothetical protein
MHEAPERRSESANHSIVTGKELTVKPSMFIVTAGAIVALAAPTALAAGPQASIDLRYLAPRAGEYALEVQNTSSQYIHGFRWAAPAPLRLTRIVKAVGGTCGLAGNTIVCRAAGIGLAPACACDLTDQLTAEFAASGDGPKRSVATTRSTMASQPTPSPPGEGSRKHREARLRRENAGGDDDRATGRSPRVGEDVRVRILGRRARQRARGTVVGRDA